MKRILTHLVTAVLVLVTGQSQAQPTVVWTRFAANVPFIQVQLSDQNQAFCLTEKGAIYRYDSTGVLLSASPEISASFDTPRMAVDSTNTSYVLYAVQTASGSMVRLRQTGGWDIAVDAETPTWKYFKPYAIHLDGAGRICVIYARRSAGSSFQWRYRRFLTNGSLADKYGGTDVVTQGTFQGKTVMTSDSRAIWAYRTAGQANTTVIQASPPYAFGLSMPGANDLAYSPNDGGSLFGVSLPNSTSITVYRVDLTSGAVVTRTIPTADLDPTPNTQMVTAPKIECDSNGRLVVMGQYLGGGTLYFHLSLNGSDLTTYGLINQIPSYIFDCAADPNGAVMFALSNLSNEARVSVVDALNWVSLGSAVQTSYVYNPRDLSVNAKGYAALVGNRIPGAGNPIEGFVWLVRQSGLMNITTPIAEITGGQTFNATLRRYYANGVPLTIALSSSSPKAVIPASAQINGLVASTTVAVQLAATAADEFVTLEATSGNAKRQARFWLKAPRPKALTLNPSTIDSPASGVATVALTGIAPTGGISVTLSSSNPNALVPATKIVPAGVASANFTLRTIQVATSQTATISATYLGVTKSATLTVTP